MFDAKELEKAEEMCRKMEKIRVIYEDGTEDEVECNIWNIIGLNTKEKANILMGKCCATGGMDAIADITLQIAQLRMVAEDLENLILGSGAGLTKEMLGFGVNVAISNLRRRREEANA